jgi:hypothetical protein
MSLESVISEALNKLCEDYELSHNYEIVLSSDESLFAFNGKMVDIRLEAGNPPKLIVTMIFMARCFPGAFTGHPEMKGKPELFMDRLLRALRKYPRMVRTLYHNIPRDRALILRDEDKKWIRTHGITQTEIPDEDFQIEYIVRVTDKVTGNSFSQAGSNVKECEKEAKARLSRIVSGNEEMQRFRDLVRGLQTNTFPIDAEKPKVVLRTTQIIEKEEGVIEQFNERREY